MHYTRDQQYAAQIFEQVNRLPKEDYQKYGTMAHKLPILIRTAGLTQAFVFVEARGEAAQQKILDHLAEVLYAAKVLPAEGRDALRTQIFSAPLGDYMVLTQKILTALVWYKRFAQSILKVGPGEDSEASSGQKGSAA